MKKMIAALVAVLLLLQVGMAFASTNEVKTFGFTDERHRDATVGGTVLFPAFYHNGGPSYSQPLILSGDRWGMADKNVIISVENNNLNGYIVSGAIGNEPPEYKEMPPVWSVKLSGSTPTKSHPTFIEHDEKRYIYIGTYSKYLNIVDITDFNSVNQNSLKPVYSPNATDITSAPLIMDWRSHEIVVCTSGNTGKLFIVTDLLTNNINSFYINAGSGRTSSSPAPVAGRTAFAVGLDGGQGYGELQIYYLDDILAESEGKVINKSKNARVVKPIHSGLAASFSVDGDMLYFGDTRSRVYAYNVVTRTPKWVNTGNAGKFSNRSPALTPTRVYFPAVGREGEQGKVLAIDRTTGKTEWAVAMKDPYTGKDLGRAMTAPAVLRGPDAAAILEGTSNGYLAIIDPSTGKIVYTLPIASKTGGK